MKRTNIKRMLLALIIASATPLAACSDDNDTPTSPTQPGPPVTEAPPTTPTPQPPAVDPTPTPTPPVVTPPTVTLTGVVVNLVRSGANSLDVSFRIDDSTVARVAAGTPVMSGSSTFDTDAIRNGQTVIVEGVRTNGFLDATKVTITAQAP